MGVVLALHALMLFAIAGAWLAAAGAAPMQLEEALAAPSHHWNEALSEAVRRTMQACELLVHGAFRVDQEELFYFWDF